MALQLRRGETRSFGKMIAASFAIMAFVLQPLVSLNIPSVFALGGSTVTIANATDLHNALLNQADGQVWKLAANTYNQEPLHITKAITIDGPTSGAAVLQVPASMTNGGKFIDIDASGVVLNRLTVSGTFPAIGCNDNEYGVYFENGASATIEDSSIVAMQDSNAALRGCQQGIAIRVGSNYAGIAATATITNVAVSGYQKGGIVVDGVGSHAVIRNGTVTGAGAVNYTAQNGIQVSRGATATIKNETITGNSYTGASTAAGILLYGAGDSTVVTGNAITGNQIGYYTDNQANLKHLNFAGITGNTRNAVAWTGADYAPSWGTPSVVWADAGINGTSDTTYGSDIVEAQGQLHVYGYDVFTTIPAAVQAVATNGTVNLGSNMSTSSQVTISKKLALNGNGYTLAPHFTKTDNGNNSALAIWASGVTVKNLIEDGTAGTNLHGINVVNATGIKLNDITVQNNDHSGLNVNASKVTVTNLSTAHNGWNGVDVDKTGAVLTVKGVSHHNEAIYDIYVDSTAIGKVVDSNNQYDFASNVKQTGDRVYDLKLAAPTTPYPATNALINTNNFWFTWSTVTGAKTYEWQGSQSNALDGDGNLANVTWTGDYQKVQPTGPTAHSIGASGTWYWQVRAVDANGIKGPWSAVWNVTVDTVAPAVPTAILKNANNQAVTSNGYINTQDDHFTFNLSSSDNIGVVKYQVKYWNSISGDQFEGQSKAWSTTVGANGVYADHFSRGEGTHYFAFSACDAAGNCSAYSSPFVVTYDKTAPVARITAPGSGDTVHGTVTVSGTVIDANPGHYYFVVKNSAGTVVAGPGVVNQVQVADWSWNTKNVPDGVYTLDLEARDAANNKDAGSTVTRTVTVDNTAPTVAITGYKVNGDGTYTISGTTNDNSSDVVVSVGLNTYKAVTPANGEWSVTTGQLPDGTYTITATSTDAANNEGTATASHTFSTPITKADQSQGVLPPAPDNTVNANAFQFFATTPTGQVLGDQTANGKTTDNGATDQAVKGVSTTKDNANSNKSSGFAWYWWVVILAVIAFLWWLIAAARRRNQAE